MTAGNDNYSAMTHQDLAQECKNYDNTAAWQEFRTRFDSLFYGRIASRTMRYGHAVVEDLVGEALYKTVRGIQHFDANQPLIPWLVAIIDNVVNDYLRGIQRRQKSIRQVALTADSREIAQLLKSRGLESHVALESIREVLEEIRPEQRLWAQAILAGHSAYRVSQQFGVSKESMYELKDRLGWLLREALRRKGSDISEPEEHNDVCEK